MKMINNVLLFLVLLIITSCGSSNYPFLEVVDSVDLQRYQGKWYEIARLPNSFQEGCYCSTAEYIIIDSTTVSVINECREDSSKGEVNDATGKAFVVEGSNNAKLKVQFFWPFKGDYWIIELDDTNYKYAVVGTPSRKYLWILSRTPKLSDSLYTELKQRISSKGFDTTKLIESDQSCYERN